MPFKGILLDLDNTLYDYKTAHQPALQVAVDWLSEQTGVDEETLKSAYKAARDQTHEQLHGQGASHSRLLYFQRVLEILSLSPFSMALQSEQVYWNEFFKHMQFRPRALDYLDVVGDLPIALLTDLTSQIQFQKVLSLQLENRLAAVVTSEEAGAEKPDARMFLLALKKLKLTTDDVCMIGDNWQRDIVGATALGIKSYWYINESGPAPGELEQYSSMVTAFDSFQTLIEVFR
ncbi:MAG: HAD family hydrolase [Candidatus Obscuribacterales bacterium]|nr:HAD family hydrolase [Candidatus Obscuribacterales bacterium]